MTGAVLSLQAVIIFLASAAPSAARGARFAASYDPAAIYRPALGAADAKAMMTACKDKSAPATVPAESGVRRG